MGGDGNGDNPVCSFRLWEDAGSARPRWQAQHGCCSGSELASAGLSQHRKAAGGGAGGQRKEEKQERIRQDAELHVKNKGERKIKDGNAKRALGICS